MIVKLQTKDPAKSLGHREVCEPPAKQNRHTIASQSPKKSQSRTYRTGSGVAKGLLEHSEGTTVAHLAIALDKFEH